MKVVRRSKSLEEYLVENGATVRGVNTSIMMEGNGVNTSIFREGNGVNPDGWVEGVSVRMDGMTILESKGIKL